MASSADLPRMRRQRARRQQYVQRGRDGGGGGGGGGGGSVRSRCFRCRADFAAAECIGKA
eukprot:6207031-Pleurochrysis_carterae.AAC.4